MTDRKGPTHDLNSEFIEAFGDQWRGNFMKLAELDEPFNPHALGGWQSFVPKLGETVSANEPQYDPQTGKVEIDPFNFHIGTLASGCRVAYVRVGHFRIDKARAAHFALLAQLFQRVSDVCVLDLVHNPGGDMLRMYDILSALTDRPLDVPKHELALTEDDVARAKTVLRRAAYADPDEPDNAPSPQIVSFSRFVVAEAEAGRARYLDPSFGANTRPAAVFGVEQITPAAAPYTKPLVVTVDEMTFSAAEFAAAILKDNERAIVFGFRTAGAGGMVREVPMSEYAESLGFTSMTLTWTFARRTNGAPIENTGIEPDLEYKLTVKDLTEGFAPYRQALEAAVNSVAGFTPSAASPHAPQSGD